MRARLFRGLLAAAVMVALPAGAATPKPARAAAPPPAPVATSAPAAVPDSEAQLAQAMRQLDAARTEIQRLRQQAAEAEAGKAALADIRAKNARLVDIGNALIAAYDKRYGNSRFLPFQTARTRFEKELQDRAEQVYQNQADAAPVRAEPTKIVNEPAADTKPQ